MLTAFSKQVRLRLAALLPTGRFKTLLGGGLWTIMAKIVAQASQLTAFLVAARVLSSYEFGFYAYSSAFALFFVIIAEGGWGEFIMKSTRDPASLSQIATISLIAGGVVTLIGLIATGVIALFFHQKEEAVLIALFACWAAPSALSTVYDGILVARARLRDQSIIRIFSELLGLAAVLAGMWLGWGIVAFVAGRLVTQLIGLAASMAVLRWLPRLELEWSTLVDVFDYSRHIVVNRLIIFFRSYSATLLVGSFLGLTEAGYYRAAERIIAAVSELVGEPARILSWTVLRQAASDAAPSPETGARIGRSATTILAILMTVSLPVYAGLALVSGPLVEFALGDAWSPVAFLVTLLALKQVLLVPGFITEPLLSLSGNIHRMPPAVLANSLVGVGFLLAMAPFGMHAAAFGQCAAAVVSFCISIFLQSRYGAMDWPKVLRDCVILLVALAVMAACVHLLGDLADLLSISDAPTMLLQTVAGAGIYIAALLAMQRFKRESLPIFSILHR